MGYADGIPRIAQGAGIFVHGKSAPIIGRVSMDQFVVDLGPDSAAKETRLALSKLGGGSEYGGGQPVKIMGCPGDWPDQPKKGGGCIWSRLGHGAAGPTPSVGGGGGGMNHVGC